MKDTPNFVDRIHTLVSMFGTEYLSEIFKHIEKNYDAIFRLKGGQLDYFVEHLNQEMKRTNRFSDLQSLANDKLGYDSIRVIAVLTHPCQLCAIDVNAWHTRRAFCHHKPVSDNSKQVEEVFGEQNKIDSNVVVRNGQVEWYCEHGVGHYLDGESTIHGCDGCCSKLTKKAILRIVKNREKYPKKFSF